jgi:hypothetical protein
MKNIRTYVDELLTYSDDEEDMIEASMFVPARIPARLGSGEDKDGWILVITVGHEVYVWTTNKFGSLA